MKLNIYRASAGSGKTFTLATEYIISAFENEKFFSRILAVTFTNKAAGEMRERILKALEDLYVNGCKSGFYPEIIKHYPNFQEPAIKQRAKKILSEILHNYSDFNIKTIDSFTQRILRTFCNDINLSSGFRVETDEDLVVMNLTNNLFNVATDEQNIYNKLLNLAKQKINDGKGWNFTSDFSKFSKLIFTQDFQNLEKRLKNIENRDTFFETASQILECIRNDFKEFLRETNSKAIEIFKNYPDIEGQTLLRIRDFFLKKIVSQDIKDFYPKQTVRDVRNNKDKWYNNNVKKVQESYMDQLYNQLNPLLDDTLKFIDKNYSEFLTAETIRKNFNYFALLYDIAEMLPQYRQENHLMLISDATVFLNDLISTGNDAPFIYERVGSKFDKLFIDEFQDTSEFQWTNFKPLVENSLASGFDDMIVGDVKQAIYRWRGGDWTLLSQKVEQQIGSEYINIKNLDTNWRSKKNIVDFNNAIFSSAVKILSQQLSTKFNDDEKSKILENIYSDFYQKLPLNDEKKSGGKVCIKFFEKSQSKQKKSSEFYDDGDDVADSPALEYLATEINVMLKSGNFKAKDICILVRTKAQGADTIKYLLDYQHKTDDAEKYEVISGESLFLCNSEPVKVIANAMEYINTKNQMSFVLMVRAYAKLKFGDKFSDDDIFKAVGGEGDFPDGLLPEGFETITESFGVLPLYDLTEKIIELFNLSAYPEYFEYVRTFEDYVLDFTKTYSSDLGKFVDWWKTTGQKRAIQPSENQNAVQIMTIHKSKGLAFRAVFVPFCDWKLFDNKESYMWVAPPKTDKFKGFMPLPIKVTNDLADTLFNKEFENEFFNLYIDALNLLYVTFTRAEEELHICCYKKSEKKSGKTDDTLSTVGHVIFHALNEFDNADYNNDKFINLKNYFSDDKFLLDENHNPQPRTEKSQGNMFNLSGLPNCDWENKLSVKFHAPNFFIEKSPFRKEKINYGLFMHELMSKIIVKDDTPAVLADMEYQGRIDAQQRAELSQKLDELMKIPQVADWFSPHWDVKNETALLRPDGAIRIPDRVMFSDSQTVIIDFKFGAKKSEEYHKQLTEYSNLLSEMGYPNVSSYLLYVETFEIDQVN